MCGLCSRLRRGALYRYAARARHHQDRARPPSRRHRRDAVPEPVLRRAAEGDGAEAALRGRPPHRDPAARLRAGARHRALRARARASRSFPARCAARSRTAQRAPVKQMLADWEREYPGRTESIFSALRNVEAAHLADPRLFDFASLAQSPAARAAHRRGSRRRRRRSMPMRRSRRRRSPRRRWRSRHDDAGRRDMKFLRRLTGGGADAGPARPLPNSYWVQPGRLLAGEYPGAPRRRGDGASGSRQLVGRRHRRLHRPDRAGRARALRAVRCRRASSTTGCAIRDHGVPRFAGPHGRDRSRRSRARWRAAGASTCTAAPASAAPAWWSAATWSRAAARRRRRSLELNRLWQQCARSRELARGAGDRRAGATSCCSWARRSRAACAGDDAHARAKRRWMRRAALRDRFQGAMLRPRDRRRAGRADADAAPGQLSRRCSDLLGGGPLRPAARRLDRRHGDGAVPRREPARERVASTRATRSRATRAGSARATCRRPASASASRASARARWPRRSGGARRSPARTTRRSSTPSRCRASRRWSCSGSRAASRGRARGRCGPQHLPGAGRAGGLPAAGGDAARGACPGSPRSRCCSPLRGPRRARPRRRAGGGDRRRLLPRPAAPTRCARTATPWTCSRRRSGPSHAHASWREGALAAVNLGGSSDVVGAIYGQLAGAHYGLRAIPWPGATAWPAARTSRTWPTGCSPRPWSGSASSRKLAGRTRPAPLGPRWSAGPSRAIAVFGLVAPVRR